MIVVFEKRGWKIKKNGDRYYFTFGEKKWYVKILKFMMHYAAVIVCLVLLAKQIYKDSEHAFLWLAIFSPILIFWFCFSKENDFDLQINFKKKYIGQILFNMCWFEELKLEIVQGQGRYGLYVQSFNTTSCCDDKLARKLGGLGGSFNHKIWSSESYDEVKQMKDYFDNIMVEAAIECDSELRQVTQWEIDNKKK